MTLSALDDMASLCCQAGAELVVILIPSKEFVYLPLAHDLLDEELRRRLEPGWHWNLVAQHCQKRGIPTVTLGPAMQAATGQGSTLYFKTNAHWNAAGHRLAAQRIAATLDDH